MSDHRLYTDRAELYDAIYSFKRYDQESEHLHELLASLGVADGGRVLEAACGTGNYLQHLRRWYAVTGFDANEAMLAIARRKLGDVPLFQADLEEFAVDQPFDAALCLFSSLSYLHTDEALGRSLACFARALRPGGVLVVDPFVGPAEFRDGATALQVHTEGPLRCARASVAHRRGDLAVLDFEWLVVREGVPAVERFTERHELLLCAPERLARLVTAAGFEVSGVDLRLVRDRHLVAGVKS